MSNADPKADGHTRRALVTGGTRGIGLGIVRALAEAGFDVAFTGRTEREGEGVEEAADGSTSPLPGSLETTAREVAQRGRDALPVRMDLLDPRSVDGAAQQVMEAWGAVDLLVNNAMYEAGRYTLAWVVDTPMEEWQRKIQANFLAPLALAKHFLPGMVARGSGCIINLSTRHNYQRQAGPPGEGGACVSYNCSKAALGKLADGIAAEHAGDGVTAFDLDPGPVWTERAATQHERLGYPRELFCPLEVPAAVVVWLATNPEAPRYSGTHFMAQEFARTRGLHPEWSTVLPMNRRWEPGAVLDWRVARKG